MPDSLRKADWAREVRLRLASLHLPAGREAEIVDELSQHLEDHYAELRAGGASHEDARRVALAEFRGGPALSGIEGNLLAQHMAPLRQSQSPPAITPGAPTAHALIGLWQDVRYAARTLIKQRGFALAAVLTLALGIGATAAIFSVVHGVLLKPLPFHEPERLVSLLHRGPGVNLPVMNQGPTTYLTYRDNHRAFEAIGAWDSNQVAITGRGDPEQVEGLSVTDSTLPLLGVRPLIGRLFNAEDTAPGSPLRVILTYGYWQRRFGGVDQIIGEPLQIDGTLAEVIGVLPSSFKFLRSDPAVVMPMQIDAVELRTIQFDRQALGRLKPDVTVSDADADIARMIPLLPESYDVLQLEPTVLPLVDEVIGDVGRLLWILLAAVGVVLLIASGNVANLFLIRAEGRQQELAMRVALGASRSRIARVLLSESLLLALAGGAFGLLLARVVIGLLHRLAPSQLPRVDEIGLDPAVLLFTVSVSVLSGALFGVVAVLRFGRPHAAALKEGGRSGSDAPARHRTRNALVVSQIALALTLLIVSGLMVRTFVAMRQVPPGFTGPEQVQTFRIAIPARLIPEAEEAARIHQRIAERLERVPGVASVGVASSITMDGEDNANPLYVEDAPVPEGTIPPLRRHKNFGPGYFETMGNRFVAGRSVAWTEIYQRRPLMVISENIAREYWSDPARAIGKRVRGQPAGRWHEIVGVVGAERDDGLNHPATAIVYWPMLSDSYSRRTMAYAVRSNRAGTSAFLRELQQAVSAINSDLPLAAVQTLQDIQARSMAQTSFAMTMLGIAAGVALFVALVGIYGVVAYVAAQRTREIGIRMALGARIADVRAIFLRHGLWLTAIGIALGIGVALVLTRAISALLFGVEPMDPMTYIAVSVVLAAVALLATYLPARRAARVDPIAALRADV